MRRAPTNALKPVLGTYVSPGSARGTLVWYQPHLGRTRYVRKYLYLAVAAASAAVLAMPIVADAAPGASSHVLTIRKVHGPAVKTGAVLKASLAKGTTAKFVIGSGTSAIKVTCKSSSFSAKVVKNPLAPNTATESVTAESIAKCTTSVMGLTIGSIKALNLPYKATVSDKKGLPVTVSGTKTKPIELKASAKLSGMTITCIYKAAKAVGAASNKGNTITFTKQKLTVAPGSNSICASIGAATFSAKYGPVQDTSVKGNPAVFVN